MPIEALRLSPETRTTLRRLGFKSVGALLDKPRAPFAARFPAELLRRLDQALGRIDEPLVPIVAPPVYHTLRYLLEPIVTQEAIVALASRLMQTLVHVLARDDVGARALRLSLYRVDGAVETIDIAPDAADAQCRPCGAPHRAEARSAGGDGGCRLRLRSGRACRHPRRNHARAAEPNSIAENAEDADRAERCAALIDTLRQRLGPQSVRRFEPVASHIPERAEVLLPVAGEASASWPEPEQKRARFLLLAPRRAGRESWRSFPTVRRGVFAGAA